MSELLIQNALKKALEEMGVAEPSVHLERPKDPTHGDWATNAAMPLAKVLRRSPRDIAEEIIERFDATGAGVDRIEVAGPGFLNFHLSSGAIAQVLAQILEQDATFGASQVGEDRRIMVEFVSANPTGPLHLGHGRQAAIGDALSTLLEWTGWSVHREYYYNDAGKQIDLLAQSVLARYRQLLGIQEEVPEGGYQGGYVLDVALALRDQEAERFKANGSEEGFEFVRDFSVRLLREDQDRDLGAFNLTFDEYYLESSLYTDGRVDATVQALKETGLVYEEGGAVWLKTTEFGDQKDRVMIRSDGNPTYFLPDVAYHMSKWERGFHHVINVQGSDHHSTVTRVRAGLQALGLPEGYPEYVLHQMVTVERDGQEVKFSKRAGSYTTLRELVDEVGPDVVRYFFLMRKPDAQLVFDLDMALDESEKNPVYKVQYAHARMCSIFRKGEISEEEIGVDGAALDLLSHELERDLLKRLADFPETLERSAASRAPHILCDYLEQTAGAVNSWYHSGNPSRNPELAVLVKDPGLRKARLALARAVRIVLRNGLGVLGVSAPTRMERTEESERA